MRGVTIGVFCKKIPFDNSGLKFAADRRRGRWAECPRLDRSLPPTVDAWRRSAKIGLKFAAVRGR